MWCFSWKICVVFIYFIISCVCGKARSLKELKMMETNLRLHLECQTRSKIITPASFVSWMLSFFFFFFLIVPCIHPTFISSSFVFAFCHFNFITWLYFLIVTKLMCCWITGTPSAKLHRFLCVK